jgi:hypothetical protein
MARTFKPLDWDKIELYLKAGATQKKIAQCLCISEDTLRSRVKQKYGVDYSVFSASLQSKGELLIEAKQFEKALSGNIQMLLWLGKIRCKQKESDIISPLSPIQNEIDKDHLIMQLQHRITELENERTDR